MGRGRGSQDLLAAMSRKSKRIEGIQFHRWDNKPLSKYRTHFKLCKATHQPKLASIVARHFQSPHLDFRNDETNILVDFFEELKGQQQQYDVQVAQQAPLDQPKLAVKNEPGFHK